MMAKQLFRMSRTPVAEACLLAEQGARVLRVRLPLPAMPLRNNGQVGPWQAVYACRKRAHELAYQTVCAVDGLDAGLPWRTYSVVWFSRGLGPDVDNVLASTKSYMDGICARLGVNDRVLELTRVLRRRAQPLPMVEIYVSAEFWQEWVMREAASLAGRWQRPAEPVSLRQGELAALLLGEGVDDG